MEDHTPASIMFHFSSLQDPRVDRTKLHSLHDILALVICSVLAGEEDCVGIQEFCEYEEEWFRTFLELPNGIPSHDTIGRVLASIDPIQFSECFISWVNAVTENLSGCDMIHLDGKTVRRSMDRVKGSKPIHIVGAFSSGLGLALGQVKTENKSNEIKAIPELLKLLNIKGCLVTIDAMGCQKAIASQIVDQGGDYVLAVKHNQGTLRKDIEDYFSGYLFERDGGQEDGVAFDEYEVTEKGHGRIEIRRCVCTADVDWFPELAKWKGLRSIGMVEARREIIATGKKSHRIRYFISSLDGTDAERFSDAVRRHWSIENQLHWVLDVRFNEDQSRLRTKHLAQNFALIRKIAINLLKQDKTPRKSLRSKRRKALHKKDYIIELLAGKAGPQDSGGK